MPPSPISRGTKYDSSTWERSISSNASTTTAARIRPTKKSASLRGERRTQSAPRIEVAAAGKSTEAAKDSGAPARQASAAVSSVSVNGAGDRACGGVRLSGRAGQRAREHAQRVRAGHSRHAAASPAPSRAHKVTDRVVAAGGAASRAARLLGWARTAGGLRRLELRCGSWAAPAPLQRDGSSNWRCTPRRLTSSSLLTPGRQIPRPRRKKAWPSRANCRKSNQQAGNEAKGWWARRVRLPTGAQDHRLHGCRMIQHRGRRCGSMHSLFGNCPHLRNADCASDGAPAGCKIKVHA